ncbi:MAG: DUF4827 family protein [Paludibacter sp.]|nr:DUF4827 family protein [Paludibacter sp.]
MKQITFLISLFFTVTVLLTSCDDKKTYAELLKDERITIAEYIKRNNIQVVTTLPTQSTWPNNTYFKTTSGLYFQLIDKGDNSETADTLETNDLVSVRYIQYSLTEKSDSIFNWNTIDSPYPTTFNFKDYSQVSTAWHEAISYMKRNESEAKIIVTSKLGFETNMRSVTPLGYRLKIKFQK